MNVPWDGSLAGGAERVASRGAQAGGARRRSLLGLGLWAGLALVAGCGGGADAGGPAANAAESPADAPQPGELPAELLFALPRNVDHTPNVALAWTSEGRYSGRIVAQIELGLSFGASDAFELQHGGAPAFHEAEDSTGLARFELRYAEGFFLLTAQRDNDVGVGLPFGVDIYPPDVPRVPPVAPPCPSVEEVCSNSLGFINFRDWPRRAGESASLLIPREDPAMLRYAVLIKVDERAEWFETIGGASGQSIVMPRGQAWRLDFPTARIKIRGCNADGQCIESAERPLQSALLAGVAALEPRGVAANGHVATDFSGHRLVVRQQLPSSTESQLLVYGRPSRDDRWFPQAQVSSALPGFGRTFALSGDGLTLAVEASPCAAVTVVCNDGTVVLYRADAQGTTWREQARFPGVRAPKLSTDGNRIAVIAIAAQRGVDAVLAFARSGDAWRELAFPAIDYTPLDLALSGEGFTLAVSRQGTRANPCGCRAVVVYDWTEPTGWQPVATVRSAKRLDSVGSPNDDGFGYAAGSHQSLSIDAAGARLAVGASLDSSDASDTVGDPANANAPQSGAIYVFQRQADRSFAKQAFVKAREAKPLDHFGHTVALNVTGALLHGGARGLAANAAGLHRNHAVDQALPAPTPGANGALAGAAAYVFEHDAGAWLPRAAMVAPNADSADFGTFHGLAVSQDGAVAVLATGVRDAGGGVARRLFVY